MTLDQAESALKAAGFTKVTPVTDDGSAVQQGDKVTKQTPGANTQAAGDTEIALVVTSGAGGGPGKG